MSSLLLNSLHDYHTRCRRNSRVEGMLKVIGAGFGRTGTSSLKAALERLGFGPAYHMSEVFEHPAHVDFWVRAAKGDPVEWPEILHNYESAVDWPACSFYKELMAEYPEAKVILTVREAGAWHESVRTTIHEISTPGPGSVLARVVGVFVPHIRKIRRMVDKLIWRGTFDGRFEEKEYAIEIFERHIEDVKKRVPPEKLLVYDVKDGWGPLCEFLGVPEPGETFPRLNDARTFRRMIMAGYVFAVAAPVLLAIAAASVIRWMSRRR